VVDPVSFAVRLIFGVVIGLIAAVLLSFRWFLAQVGERAIQIAYANSRRIAAAGALIPRWFGR